MRREVVLTDSAAQDLEEIYDYVAEHDAPAKAEYVLGRLAKVIESLAQAPGRGAHPRELLAIGMREHRELFFKPYRVIYRIVGRKVSVLLIADGRRDMQSLLERCLLRGV